MSVPRQAGKSNCALTAGEQQSAPKEHGLVWQAVLPVLVQFNQPVMNEGVYHAHRLVG